MNQKDRSLITPVLFKEEVDLMNKDNNDQLFPPAMVLSIPSKNKKGSNFKDAFPKKTKPLFNPSMVVGKSSKLNIPKHE